MAEQQQDLQAIVDRIAHALHAMLQIQNSGGSITSAVAAIAVASAHVLMQRFEITPDEFYAAIKDNIFDDEGREFARKALGARVQLTVVPGGMDSEEPK